VERTKRDQFTIESIIAGITAKKNFSPNKNAVVEKDRVLRGTVAAGEQLLRRWSGWDVADKLERRPNGNFVCSLNPNYNGG